MSYMIPLRTGSLTTTSVNLSDVTLKPGILNLNWGHYQDEIQLI